MATATANPPAVVVAPFGIEINTSRNNDVIIQSIPGCKLRGRCEASRPVIDQKSQEPMVPRDQMIGLGAVPNIPGQELHVDPASLSYVIRDPLHGNEKLCGQIKKRLEEAGVYRTGGKIDGLPPKSGKLDVHRMKTLVREMLHLVSEGMATLVKKSGPLPRLEDIDELPGHYLQNPGAVVPNSQPVFEKDMAEWQADLTRRGG